MKSLEAVAHRHVVMKSLAADRPSIEYTREVIRPHIRQTPVVWVEGADFGLESCRLAVKLEHAQHAGSFKTRGAFANLLMREIPAAGVVAASGGNHGAAVAYAAMRVGVSARIFVPTIASPAKVVRIRACGATIELVGDRYADALSASEDWAARTAALRVHAFDQLETLLGQGTLGAEFSVQAPDLDTVIVAVGGGGLIGGVAGWFRGDVRVIGVEPDLAPTLTLALQAGRPVEAPAGGIAADSLAPRQVGDLMFPIAQQFVHAVALVSDASIVAAQQHLWDRLRIVAEPAGAAPLAALLSGAYVPHSGERIGLVISGGNTHAVSFE